jgi:hypothetical protein
MKKTLLLALGLLGMTVSVCRADAPPPLPDLPADNSQTSQSQLPSDAVAPIPQTTPQAGFMHGVTSFLKKTSVIKSDNSLKITEVSRDESGINLRLENQSYRYPARGEIQLAFSTFFDQRTFNIDDLNIELNPQQVTQIRAPWSQGDINPPPKDIYALTWSITGGSIRRSQIICEEPTVQQLEAKQKEIADAELAKAEAERKAAFNQAILNGMNAYKAKQFDNAIVQFSIAVNSNPKDTNAVSWLSASKNEKAKLDQIEATKSVTPGHNHITVGLKKGVKRIQHDSTSGSTGYSGRSLQEIEIDNVQKQLANKCAEWAREAPYNQGVPLPVECR